MNKKQFANYSIKYFFSIRERSSVKNFAPIYVVNYDKTRKNLV